MSQIPFSWRGRVVVVAALLLVAVQAAAQDRLFIAGSQGGDGYEIGAVGRFGQVLGPSRGLARPLVGGGRFAVVGSDVYDLRSGASRPLPSGATAAAFDPARPRIFIVTPSTSVPPVEVVAAFDVVAGSTSGIADVPSCSTPFGRRPEVRYAPGGERLFVERCAAASGDASDVLVFDIQSATLVPLPALPASLPVGATVLPSPDGTRLFVYVNGTLTAWDVTAARVVAVSNPPAAVTALTWDDARQWLFASTSLTPGFVETVTAWTRDLAPLGTATFPGTGPCGVRVQGSPHTGRLYVTVGGGDHIPSEGLRFAVFAGASPALQAQAPLSGGVSTTCEGAVVRTAPGPPRNLRASVSGHAVSLAWENVGGASSFVLEVGAAPARTDLSIFSGPDSQSSFANVPPGTYYVRVRGANAFGGGHPSNEIRVVVP